MVDLIQKGFSQLLETTEIHEPIKNKIYLNCIKDVLKYRAN